MFYAVFSLLLIFSFCINSVKSDIIAQCMSATPYVEESCQSTVYKKWPYEAKLCTYSSPIGKLKVSVADPDASVVASWINNATREVNWVAKLEETDHSNWFQIKKILATDVMLQSGRIFPLSGDIGENMDGSKYVAYHFTDGESDGAPSGEPHAFCRINSLTRGQLCSWNDHKNIESESKCQTRLGYGQGNTEAWYSECINNHIYAWTSEYNAHFVAKLWACLNNAGISGQSTGDEIVNALYSELGFNAKTVDSFC